MFKSYIPSVIGFLLGVGAIVFLLEFTSIMDVENTKYTAVFNSATIERKIIGKKLDYVTEHYLAPTSTKKAGKGNIVANYDDDVRIFTRGEKTVIEAMVITYQDSVATAITYGEPQKCLDASAANFSPLSFTLINKEIFTRMKTAKQEQASGKEAGLLLLWVFLMAILPFLLSWPLATLAAKKMEYPWSALAVVAGWLLLGWIYAGIWAYAIGTVMIFLVIGGIWFIVSAKRFFKTVNPDQEVTYAGQDSYDDSGHDYNDNSNPARVQDYVYHIQNLAVIVSLASYAKNISEARAEFLTKIAMKEGIGIELFNKALSSPTLNCHQPSDPSLKDEFVDNFAKLVLCDTSFSTVQLGAAITMAKGFGLTEEEFGARLRSIATNVYHRDYSSYKVLKA